MTEPLRYDVTLFRAIGAAIYGEHFVSALARDLGTALRTAQRYASGRRSIPPGVWHDLRLLAAKSSADLYDRTALLARFTAMPAPLRKE